MSRKAILLPDDTDDEQARYELEFLGTEDAKIIELTEDCECVVEGEHRFVINEWDEDE